MMNEDISEEEFDYFSLKYNVKYLPMFLIKQGH